MFTNLNLKFNTNSILFKSQDKASLKQTLQCNNQQKFINKIVK